MTNTKPFLFIEIATHCGNMVGKWCTHRGHIDEPLGECAYELCPVYREEMIKRTKAQEARPVPEEAAEKQALQTHNT